MNSTRKIKIIIPSRYASTRLPGKPLVLIAEIPMIKRVAQIAEHVANKYTNCSYVVATDDSRIEEYCSENKIPVVMTSSTCRTGTERVLEAALKEGATNDDIIINLQGDAPLTPPSFIEGLIDAFVNDSSTQIATPCENLTWEAYERLKENKKTTPFSGTTAIVRTENINDIWEKNLFTAVWFSKTIIPSLRKIDKLKELNNQRSPILRHIGLYGYNLNVLKEVGNVDDSIYGSGMCEGLEQLKFIEGGYNTKIVKVDYGTKTGMSGVDSPEDVKRTEEIIAKYGELKL